jgi:hypothetical protein
MFLRQSLFGTQEFHRNYVEISYESVYFHRKNTRTGKKKPRISAMPDSTGTQTWSRNKVLRKTETVREKKARYSRTVHQPTGPIYHKRWHVFLGPFTIKDGIGHVFLGPFTIKEGKE